jgi:hypothetical protein
LESYQGRAEVVESDEVLLAVVASVGLDVAEAQSILSSEIYAKKCERSSSSINKRAFILCLRSSSMTSTSSRVGNLLRYLSKHLRQIASDEV